MHTNMIHTTLLALCYLDKFQTLKSRPQGVQLVHFHSKVNKICTRYKIQFSEESEQYYTAATCPNLLISLLTCICRTP